MTTITKFFLPALAAAALSMPASAAILTFDLDCVLNPPSGSPCQAGQSFGTVTLTDVAANEVQLSVNLINSGIKFRDLMLNLTPGFTEGTSTVEIKNLASNLEVDYNFFQIDGPYDGLFDLGIKGGQGWNTSAATPYTVTLTATGLSTSSFNVTDSFGKVYVGLHLQSIGPNGCDGDGPTFCTPGQTGNGSLKIGGTFDSLITTNSVPEPSTMGMMGVALAGLGFIARRKRS